MKSLLRIPSTGAVLVLLLMFVISLSAQTTGTGTINGTITDATGARIANANVIATQVSTGLSRSTVTNNDGLFVLPALRSGTYTLQVEAQGFAPIRQENVVLDSDSTQTVDLSTKVGGANETVEVSTAPPALNSSTGALGDLISGTQVTELPLNGRNFTQLLTLGTGVSSSQTGLRMGTGQEGNPLLSINGGRQNANAFTFDGILAMDTGGNRGVNLFPPMEAIQEMQVHTSNYTADIGSYGYGQVNIVTRSGGSIFHGDAYDVFANDALNARNFFNTSKPPLRDNNFGYDVGGPLFPHSSGNVRKGLFFFFSEAFDKRSGPELTSFTSPPQSTFTAIVPTLAQRSGDFSGISQTIYNPATGLPYAGNKITNIDPNAQILLDAYFPDPNTTSSTNYVVSPKSRTNWREELIRVDSTLGEHDTIMARFAHDAWSQDQAIIRPSNQSFPTIGGTFSKPGQNSVLQWTHIFGPRVVNQATIGYSRNAITQTPNASGQRPAGLTIPSLFNGNAVNTIPTITLGGGYSGIGITGLSENTNNVYTWRDDVTIQLGTHTIKAGANILRIQKFDRFPYVGQAGNFTFDGSATAAGHTGQGNAFADFLTGQAFSYAEVGAVPNGYFFANMFEGYLQDTWKARPNLTIDYGLRDTIMQGTPTGFEKFNNMSDFVPSLYSATAAPTILASNGAIVNGSGDPLNGIITATNKKGLALPNSLTPARNQLGPRVGFAWTPANSQKSVVRGGYGIFYHWDNDNRENVTQNPPFAQSATAFGVSLSNFGGTSATSFPANLNAFDTHKLYPSIQQYSLTVEQQLPFATTLAISYAGNSARHLDQTPNINQLQPGQLTAGTNVNALRPFKGYGTIAYDVRSASAKYNALQVNLRRRFQNGLLFGVAYTWSKAEGEQIGQSQFFNENGVTPYDRPQMVTINYVYAEPYFTHGSFMERSLLAGWEVSGVSNFQSGLAYTAAISTDVAGVGNTGQRPNRIAPLSYSSRNVLGYFSTASYALPSSGHFGNEGLNDIRGPGIDLTQVNLAKNATIKKVNIKFETEFFNLFNHANFNGLGLTYGSANFGQLTSALDPRNIQFKLKASF